MHMEETKNHDYFAEIPGNNLKKGKVVNFLVLVNFTYLT